MSVPASTESSTSGLSTIVLIHSVCGLRPAVHAAADRLRAAGHEVIVPDLFDGRTADSVPDGILIKDEIGKDELLKRAVMAVAPYSDRGLVYAGFSFGGSVAQNLALGDEKTRGCSCCTAPPTSRRAPSPRTCRCSCMSPTPTRTSRTTG